MIEFERPRPGSSGLFGRILAGVNGSAASMKAAESAIALARSNPRAELAFAYIVDVNGLLTSAEREYRDFTLLFEEVRAAATATLRLAAQLAAKAGVPSTQIIREGSAAAGLCALAGQMRADVIAIGSRRTLKIGRLCGGSVRDGVLDGSACPVFVVSEDENALRDSRRGA